MSDDVCHGFLYMTKLDLQEEAMTDLQLLVVILGKFLGVCLSPWHDVKKRIHQSLL